MEIVIIREAIGWIANALFAYSPFPQARRSWKEKHSDGIEAQMLWVWFLGEALSVIYIGMQSKILLPLMFNFSSNVILIGVILYFKYFGSKRNAIKNQK